MKNPKDTLLEDIQKCMTDPIYDIEKNFSLEKSRFYYDRWVKEWEDGNYKQNPAAKNEEVSFAFANLDDLSLKSIEAQNTFINLKREDFNKGVEWGLYGMNIVVSWYRLKTFDEWLYEGLKDALTAACGAPEDGARKILEKKFGSSMFTNSAIHLFIEGKINKETLERLGTYERYQPITGRDIEKDIEEAKKALEDIEECNKKDITVLTFKI